MGKVSKLESGWWEVAIVYSGVAWRRERGNTQDREKGGIAEGKGEPGNICMGEGRGNKSQI
jgi:hypothetical protein